jgi:hypothetical protein
MGQFDTNYIIFINVKIFKTHFFQKKNLLRKMTNVMEYVRLYHLSKWNPQNKLIIWQTCVQVNTKVLGTRVYNTHARLTCVVLQSDTLCRA